MWISRVTQNVHFAKELVNNAVDELHGHVRYFIDEFIFGIRQYLD
jgi:hypothetical protein